MKNMNSKEKSTIIMVCLLALAICAIFAGTTYAFLSASTVNNPVTNTFIGLGGGTILDPTVDPHDNSNFFLNESKATLRADKTGYDLDTTQKVLENTYSDVVTKMSIAKDPAVTINVADGISVYVFVEIVNNTQGNIICETTSNWTELTGVTGSKGGKVYLYNNAAIVGTSGKELDKVGILNGNKVDVISTSLTDVDTYKDGIQLGTIKLYAYVTQSVGFSSPSEAYTQSFPRS